MKKIITNYNIVDDGSYVVENEEKSLEPIIKVPVFNDEEPIIIAQPEEPVEEVEDTTPKETILQLVRNNEGIVIGIEVQCICGEKIWIKMEY